MLVTCLENPTDACSIVRDAKEDVLASYQKTAWDLHLHKFELTMCLGYHSCLTQRLRSHKHTESVVYLLPYNNIVLLFTGVRTRGAGGAIAPPSHKIGGAEPL